MGGHIQGSIKYCHILETVYRGPRPCDVVRVNPLLRLGRDVHSLSHQSRCKYDTANAASKCDEFPMMEDMRTSWTWDQRKFTGHRALAFKSTISFIDEVILISFVLNYLLHNLWIRFICLYFRLSRPCRAGVRQMFSMKQVLVSLILYWIPNLFRDCWIFSLEIHTTFGSMRDGFQGSGKQRSHPKLSHLATRVTFTWWIIFNHCPCYFHQPTNKWHRYPRIYELSQLILTLLPCDCQIRCMNSLRFTWQM